MEERMTLRGRRHRLIAPGVGAGIAVASVLAACHPTTRPTPAPPFAGANIDTVPLSAINAYANTLTFDTTAPASDRITVVDSLNVQAHALIAPEIGSISLESTQLEQGRIIALIRSDATSLPLGLTAGRAYMWVDSSANGWRAVTISDTNYARRVDTLIYRPEAKLPPPSFAKARWETYPFRTDSDPPTVLLFSNVMCGKPYILKCCGLARGNLTKLDSVLTRTDKALY
jgi:hypothetical protein